MHLLVVLLRDAITANPQRAIVELTGYPNDIFNSALRVDVVKVR
jgi:hypothetical protein